MLVLLIPLIGVVIARVIVGIMEWDLVCVHYVLRIQYLKPLARRRLRLVIVVYVTRITTPRLLLGYLLPWLVLPAPTGQLLWGHLIVMFLTIVIVVCVKLVSTWPLRGQQHLLPSVLPVPLDRRLLPPPLPSIPLPVALSALKDTISQSRPPLPPPQPASNAPQTQPPLDPQLPP